MTEDENDKQKCSKSFKIILYKKHENRTIPVYSCIYKKSVSPICVCPSLNPYFVQQIQLQPPSSVDDRPRPTDGLVIYIEYLVNQKTFFDSNLRMTAKEFDQQGGQTWLAPGQ